MQNIDYSRAKKIKIILGVVLFFIVLLVSLKFLIAPGKKEAKEVLLIQSAPISVLQPRFPKITIDGNDIEITENGFKTNIDGKEVMITENGKVYVKDKDGKFTRADEETAKKALELLDKAGKEDESFKLGGGADIQESGKNADKITDLTTLSDDELREYAKRNGLDYDKLKNDVENAKKEGKSYTGEEAQTKGEVDRAVENMVKELELPLSADEVQKIIDEKYNGDAQAFFTDVMKKGTDNVLPGTNNGEKEKKSNTTEKKDERYNNSNFTYDDYLSGLTDSLDGIVNPPSKADKQNNQSGKKNFLSDNQKQTKLLSFEKKENMITRGTIINATLASGINTDLPGTCFAIVSQNVLDSFTMQNVIIPKGSRIIGSYDSSVSYGQRRVLIVWSEIIRPDGAIIQLNGYETLDGEGAGKGGRVDNHILSIASSAGLMSLISYADNKISSLTQIEALRDILTGASESSASIGEKIIDKQLDRQPTISIPKGAGVSIIANDNIELPLFEEW